MGFPGGTSGKDPTCQCKRHERPGFDPWVGKIPWRRALQLTPVFLPEESPWTEEPGRLQYCCCCCCYVTSVVSDSLRPYGL